MPTLSELQQQLKNANTVTEQLFYLGKIAFILGVSNYEKIVVIALEEKKMPYSANSRMIAAAVLSITSALPRPFIFVRDEAMEEQYRAFFEACGIDAPLTRDLAYCPRLELTQELAQASSVDTKLPILNEIFGRTTGNFLNSTELIKVKKILFLDPAQIDDHIAKLPTKPQIVVKVLLCLTGQKDHINTNYRDAYDYEKFFKYAGIRDNQVHIGIVASKVMKELKENEASKDDSDSSRPGSSF
jgi:hypothetical protein